MEDKRIRKTKRNMKESLCRLLNTVCFEKITVSELCRAADTSRITFYTYYDDKYALVDDMFHDFIEEATRDYYRLEAENNLNHDTRKGYLNLLQCISNLYNNNLSFFRHATPSENPYLYAVFYRHTLSSVDRYIQNHNKYFVSKYPSIQTAALLCNGLWGVISELSSNLKEEEVRNNIIRMYCDILDSAIFISC